VVNRPILRRSFLAGAAALAARPAAADDPPIAGANVIRILYLRSTERHPTISPVDRPSPDGGLAGAQIAIGDNNTTGRFLGQGYELLDIPASQ